MAVPARDERDLAFARAFGLPVRDVPERDGPDAGDRGVGDRGAGEGVGEPAVVYRLRDWLLSRQRYWGTPIPIVHCPACGEVPVPDAELPVRLPSSGYELRPAGGESPLESARDWVRVACPACGGPARRETDTMDTFVDSSWYFLRYPNPAYADGPFDPVGVARWLPVDHYVGGKEHATGHLMYARFMTKALHDLGLVPFTEPFRRLTNQGQVTMNGRSMSKTLGNLVDLQEQLAKYGPDAVRVTMVFAGPPAEDIDWADVRPDGAVRWLARVWRLAGDLGQVPPGAGDPASGGGASGDGALRRRVHRFVHEITELMTATRLNVAVARMMELTTLLRRAPDRADPAVRDGVEALVRMVSTVAPFTAEEAWERLGRPPSVAEYGWPEVDPALLVEETVTCVVQVAGKVRERLAVPAGVTADALRELALHSTAVRRALHGAAVGRVVVRPPRLVNVVPKE
jgi:leucyl-tRNA synthetase